MAPHTLIWWILSVNRDAGQADLPIIKVWLNIDEIYGN